MSDSTRTLAPVNAVEARTEIEAWALVWQHLTAGTSRDLAIAAEEWAKAGRSLKDKLLELAEAPPGTSVTRAAEDSRFICLLAPWMFGSTFTDPQPAGSGWSFAWTLFDHEEPTGRLVVEREPVRFILA